ncbi:Uncharacterized protein FKW44_016257, partial [Caligus rogercresseyi]
KFDEKQRKKWDKENRQRLKDDERRKLKDEKRRLKEEKEKRDSEAKARKKEGKSKLKTNSLQATPTLEDFRAGPDKPVPLFLNKCISYIEKEAWTRKDSIAYPETGPTLIFYSKSLMK